MIYTLYIEALLRHLSKAAGITRSIVSAQIITHDLLGDHNPLFENVGLETCQARSDDEGGFM